MNKRSRTSLGAVGRIISSHRNNARAGWVDRLLGELGIPTDSTAGRKQLEQCMETRWPQEDGDEFKPLRRGWCLGSETFRNELLANVHTRATESHHAQTRQESTEENARPTAARATR